jgi:hypothetical protein
MTVRMQITVNGVVYPVYRDVAHHHPDAVHAALETENEAELQRGLDTLNVSDWYGADGKHLGPDINGLEMFEEA